MIPVGSEFERKASKLHLNDEPSLLPVDELSEIFPDGAPRKNVHIVVRAPFEGVC
jgi:hypothetical protein